MGGYFGYGSPVGAVPSTFDCPDGNTSAPYPVTQEFFRTDAGFGWRHPGPGGLLEGNATRTELGSTYKWSWSLHPEG